MIISRSSLSAVREVGLWIGRRRHRLRVVGDSMLPTLADGEFVLVDSGTAPAVGRLAVAAHPSTPGLNVVKRVGEIRPDGSYVLVSDNPDQGTDSRTWGPVPASAIAGQVTLLLDRPLRDMAGGPKTSWRRWLRR